MQCVAVCKNALRVPNQLLPVMMVYVTASIIVN
jgi:hypothetical protein